MPQNANTETVTLKLPSGEMVDFVVPAGLSNDQVKSLAQKKLPEEFPREQFSQQDIKDLIDIRSKLPQDDARADKIDRLLFQTIPQQAKFPATFDGMMQSIQRQMAVAQPGAYQTRKGGPIQ